MLPISLLLSAQVVAADPAPVSATALRDAKVMIGLERLAGWSAFNTSDDRTYGNATLYDQTTDAFRLPWTWREPPPAYAYRAPRVTLDGVRGKVTFGGSLMVFAPHAEPKTTNEAVQSLSVDSTVFGLGARIGYLLCDRARFCFWGKAGLAFTWIDSNEHLVGINPRFGGPLIVETTTKVKIRMVGASIEPTLVVGVVPHVAVSIAPVLDWPLFGGATYQTGDVLTKGGGRVLNAGLALGVTAWL